MRYVSYDCNDRKMGNRKSQVWLNDQLRTVMDTHQKRAVVLYLLHRSLKKDSKGSVAPRSNANRADATRRGCGRPRPVRFY